MVVYRYTYKKFIKFFLSVVAHHCKWIIFDYIGA